MTSKADRLIADAVAGVIAARIEAALVAYGIRIDPSHTTARDQSVAAVDDLRRDGWHITPHPTPPNGTR